MHLSALLIYRTRNRNIYIYVYIYIYIYSFYFISLILFIQRILINLFSGLVHSITCYTSIPQLTSRSLLSCQKDFRKQGIDNPNNSGASCASATTRIDIGPRLTCVRACVRARAYMCASCMLFLDLVFPAALSVCFVDAIHSSFPLSNRVSRYAATNTRGPAGVEGGRVISAS